MPRIADHPRAALPRTLELAAAVEELGGECSQAAAAARLGVRPGGTFGALVSTAVKFGWLAVRRGRLRAEGRYRDYRLAYDDAERRAVVFEAMQAVPLFRQLVDRFAGRALPEDHLPKLLAREYGVPEAAATRVAGYFVEAAVAAGLLAGSQLRATPVGAEGTATRTGFGPPASIAGSTVAASPARGDPDVARERAGLRAGGSARDRTVPREDAATGAPVYRVSVAGPDVDTTVDVASPEDLDLVRAALAKVERGLRSRRGGT